MNYDKAPQQEQMTIINALISRLDKAICFYASVSVEISCRLNNLSGPKIQEAQTETKESPPSCALEELQRLIIRLEENNNYLERQETRLKEII